MKFLTLVTSVLTSEKRPTGLVSYFNIRKNALTGVTNFAKFPEYMRYAKALFPGGSLIAILLSGVRFVMKPTKRPTHLRSRFQS